jgi:hypothetical protein
MAGEGWGEGDRIDILPFDTPSRHGVTAGRFIGIACLLKRNYKSSAKILKRFLPKEGKRGICWVMGVF